VSEPSVPCDAGTPPRGPWREVALLFLKLGTISFGGPAAHNALMEDEVVRRRGWLSRERFLDLLSAANLIPGPNSTELAIHVGWQRAGWRGLLAGGLGFILPATLIVTVLAWLYTTYQKLPQLDALLYGVKPVVLAIIVRALLRFGHTALKIPNPNPSPPRGRGQGEGGGSDAPTPTYLGQSSMTTAEAVALPADPTLPQPHPARAGGRSGPLKSWALGALCLSAFVLNLIGVHELIVLFGAGALWMVVERLAMQAGTPLPPRGEDGVRGNAAPPKPSADPAAARDTMSHPLGGRTGNGTEPTRYVCAWLPASWPPAWAAPAGAAAAGAPAVGAAAVGLWPMFWFFVKVGSVLFGSGYVLLAFLRADLVERWGWLTEGQLLDAIAIGQVTPGPLFTTATFIGYLLGGLPGALLATAGIFLPAFIFVGVSAPIIPRLRRSPTAAAFLDGVNVASLALMAVVTCYLVRTALVDLPTCGLALAAALCLLRFPLNSAWLILAGGLLGLCLA